MKLTIAALCLLLACSAGYANDFSKHFADSTLQVDFTVHGPRHGRSIMVDTITVSPGWWGRRVNLKDTRYPESLEYYLTDPESGDTIYRETKSFYTEGNRHDPAASMRLPMPRRAAKLHIRTHRVDTCYALTDSVLASARRFIPDAGAYSIVRLAPDPAHAITLTYVAEGYTADEIPDFYRHVAQADSAFFSHDAFCQNYDKFNIVAVPLISKESGISRPSKGLTVDTPLKSHFDSYSLERLLTIDDPFHLSRLLTGIPCQFAIVLANTDNYGGSGSYNDYCIGASRSHDWTEVIVHEFGHSFGNLGDEYEDGYDVIFPPDREPIEPNLSTLVDFKNKWQDLINAGEAGFYKGGGYQSDGIWRGYPTCLMRSLADARFCPVCTRALSQAIHFLTLTLPEH